MKDWKETIREVLNAEIGDMEYAVRTFGEINYANQQNWASSRLASLRNALDQFEKVVKENDELRDENMRLRTTPDNWDQPLGDGLRDDELF